MKSATCSDHMEAHWQSPEILSEGWTLPNMEHHWYLPLVYYLSDYIPNSEGTRIAVPSNGLQSHVYYRKCSGLYFIRGIGGLFNKDRCREVDVVVGKCMRAISNSLSSSDSVSTMCVIVMNDIDNPNWWRTSIIRREALVVHASSPSLTWTLQEAREWR